jgi:23S rRNA pseudouridine2605 synthase
MASERIQKILSQGGHGSRREMEKWIANGWIQINGVVAKLGDCASAKDILMVQGKLVPNPLKKQVKTRILLYHKPIGEISSRADPKFTQTVFDNLPTLKQGRWVQVGRLDLNTSGLLIFTNDGELANQLMHPRYGLDREYAVRVHGMVSEDTLDILKKGVLLDDGMAHFKRIAWKGGEGTNTWYHVTLEEGRNREVRRLWESQGVQVSRLIRIRYGQFTLPRFLSRGQYYELESLEVERYLKGQQHEKKPRRTPTHRTR